MKYPTEKDKFCLYDVSHTGFFKFALTISSNVNYKGPKERTMKELLDFLDVNKLKYSDVVFMENNKEYNLGLLIKIIWAIPGVSLEKLKRGFIFYVKDMEWYKKQTK